MQATAQRAGKSASPSPLLNVVHTKVKKARKRLQKRTSNPPKSHGHTQSGQFAVKELSPSEQLPGELRNAIYEVLLGQIAPRQPSDPSPFFYDLWGMGNYSDYDFTPYLAYHALAQTNHAIRREMTSLLTKHSLPCFYFDKFSSTKLRTFARRCSQAGAVALPMRVVVRWYPFGWPTGLDMDFFFRWWEQQVGIPPIPRREMLRRMYQDHDQGSVIITDPDRFEKQDSEDVVESFTVIGAPEYRIATCARRAKGNAHVVSKTITREHIGPNPEERENRPYSEGDFDDIQVMEGFLSDINWAEADKMVEEWKKSQRPAGVAGGGGFREEVIALVVGLVVCGGALLVGLLAYRMLKLLVHLAQSLGLPCSWWDLRQWMSLGSDLLWWFAEGLWWWLYALSLQQFADVEGWRDIKMAELRRDMRRENVN
jgi:hypothetical protein